MTTLRTAAQQALEALEWHYRQGHSNTLGGWRLKIDEQALRNLKAALAKPVQEPGFWGRVAARQAGRIKQLETAAQQALVALEKYQRMMLAEAGCQSAEGEAAIDTFRAALAEPQEPDYWQEEARRYAGNADYWRKRYEALAVMRTAMPARARTARQGLPVEVPHE